MKTLIFKKITRVASDFYETIEVFSDGTIECGVYYRKDKYFEYWGR